MWESRGRRELKIESKQLGGWAEKKRYIHTSQCVGVCVCADEGVNDVRVT